MNTSAFSAFLSIVIILALIAVIIVSVGVLFIGFFKSAANAEDISARAREMERRG